MERPTKPIIDIVDGQKQYRIDLFSSTEINDSGNRNGSGFIRGTTDDYQLTCFIPGHVTSSKNSKRIVRTKAGGSMLINSKSTSKYKKDFGIFYKIDSAKFKNACDKQGYPVDIEFSFVRSTAHDFDWINPAQTVQDMMVEYGWIPDDSVTYLRPSFGKQWVDKKNPGVYIKLLKK